MCNKLREVLSTMKETNNPMTKKEMIPTLKAIGEDMERQSIKIENLETKVDNLQKTQNSILETQNSILSMVQTINKKLDDDKIEEKAFAYDQNQKIVRNWKVIAVITLIIMLAGAGVLKLLDKADNIATISKAIKK